jgi:hypothetical protein
MGLGNGGPHAGSGLAVSLAKKLVCLRGEFLSAAEMLWSGHGCSVRLAVRYGTDYRAGSPANSPTSACGRRSRLRIRSAHPACERPVPAVVRRFEEHGLPELLMATVARDPDVSHAAATPGRLPGRLAEARRPAHLRLAGPQPVTERTGLRFVLEQRSGHPNDHALTGCRESMIIVTCTDDR